MTALHDDSVPFSDLLRHPTETADRLRTSRAVRLRRRGAGDLVLMSADRADAEHEVIELVARLLVTIAQSQRASLADLLPGALPWMRFLPHADAETMTAEFIDAAEAAAALGNTAAINRLVVEWRHTAEVHADPDLRRALADPELGDFGPVDRPTEG
ncbi:hypothetical protein [Promicromonospora umidemergens]|uniref:Prevent-host-death family protein n=1 Tax=Promicromonospora umidemergens TaxID=629679 RepID=A0ABP8XXF4_9MICO|nr:hypothetical protein [Promicromonospora umidemergens]